jgi:hypothetical protein
MLAVEQHPSLFADVALPKCDLIHVHRSKISLHHAKDGYNYPTIRLPYTFSVLAGLPSQIYQTVYDGALAFLVVISSKKEQASENPKSSAFTPRRLLVRSIA